MTSSQTRVTVAAVQTAPVFELTVHDDPPPSPVAAAEPQSVRVERRAGD